MKIGDARSMTGGVIHSREASGDLVIESKEIVSFDYDFTTNGSFYRGYRIPYNFCILSIKEDLDHAKVNIFMEDYEPLRLEFFVDLDKLKLLQDLVEKEKLASSSGKYRKVAGIPAGAGSELSIKYASGEAINAYDNTGHVLPALATGLIYDFFRELALEAGQEDFASKHYRLRSNQEYKVIARGTWLEKKSDFTLEFDDNKLKISEGEKVIYDDNFSITIGRFLNQDGGSKIGPFYNIYLEDEEIIANEFGKDDLIFSHGDNYYLQMIQGSWQDQGGRYRLDFKDSTLEIYEDAKLILKDDVVLEYGSISLKDKEDQDIGPFRNLYAEIGYIQVLPYVGEGEDKRIIFYPN